MHLDRKIGEVGSLGLAALDLLRRGNRRRKSSDASPADPEVGDAAGANQRRPITGYRSTYDNLSRLARPLGSG